MTHVMSMVTGKMFNVSKVKEIWKYIYDFVRVPVKCNYKP